MPDVDGHALLFRSEQVGWKAVAQISKDGSEISGLFEDGRHVLEVRPQEVPSGTPRTDRAMRQQQHMEHVVKRQGFGRLAQGLLLREQQGSERSGEADAADEEWGGDKWYGKGQCYQGDDLQHTMTL